MAQSNWRWCTKCQGLFFGGHATKGHCPAGGAHSQSGSGNYVLNTPPLVGEQSNWRWCNECEGLFFAGNSNGVCPAGGAHSQTGSGDYSQRFPPASGTQGDWRWCNKCQGMFFAGNFTTGTCPAPTGGHNYKGSGDYGLAQV
jgi:hypothetical protein